jgi:hypothetical protein
MAELFTREEQVALHDMLVKSGSPDINIAAPAMREVAKAAELVLRKGNLVGDIYSSIFTRIPLDGNATAEFPLDLLAPGTEKDWVAYTIPHQGYIPQRAVSGDFVNVPIYDIGAAIDWSLKYARDARWDIVGRCMEIMRAQFTKKLNDDAWHTILAAGVDRNIIVSDSDAAAGQFTKRLVSLLQNVMTRNGGGNSASLSHGRLTDLFTSPESFADIRNWNVDQVDDGTRNRIFNSREENVLSDIFGVRLHSLYELGEGQEYQLYFEDQLSGVLPGSDVELAVGLDLTDSFVFVMPVKEDPQTFDDPTLHRQRRAGVYGWASQGFAVLDTRRVLLGSL